MMPAYLMALLAHVNTCRHCYDNPLDPCASALASMEPWWANQLSKISAGIPSAVNAPERRNTGEKQNGE